MGAILVGPDNVSLELGMGLDALLTEHIQVVPLSAVTHIHN
jgi:hypothetical protein